MNTRADLIAKLAADPVLAHSFLFEHRHPQAMPPFHEHMIADWHGPARQVLLMSFRGSAKSTLSEEAIAIRSCFRRHKNCIIIGASEDRAKERLGAIKHEFETNEKIYSLFGDMVGPTWGSEKIVLSNGIVIQAFGRGQALRGAKHLDHRPDLCVGDDLEDDECVATPEARAKFRKWWTATVLPALDPDVYTRVTATPLDDDAAAVRWSKQKEYWTVHKYPAVKINPLTGEEESTWPERFPLRTRADGVKGLLDIKQEYLDSGSATEWEREYMVKAVADEDRQFVDTMFKTNIDVIRKPWTPTYAVYDPARTVNKESSAHTGKVVFSWMGRKLMIWKSGGHFWKPDEIIDDIFSVDDEFSPTQIGVEQDGLHEFIMQPLRHAMVQREQIIPIRALKAPKSKLDFIKGLRPFFKAGEIEFCERDGGNHDELRKQLLGFPTGRIDVPNALAYALIMRPGAPMIDTFSDDHVRECIDNKREPIYLLVNTDGTCTTGMLVQYVSGRVNVLGDWVREGDPGSTLYDIVNAVGLEARRQPRYMAPPSHFSDYDTFGLRPAAAKIPVTVLRGGPLVAGREDLRGFMRAAAGERMALGIDPLATWTLRAMAGGYRKSIDRSGRLLEEAEENVYRVLVESLESFCAMLGIGRGLDEDGGRNYATAPDGRQYLSAFAAGHRR